MSIFENLLNMRPDILEIQEQLEEDRKANEELDGEKNNEPLLITWTLDDRPDTMYTLVISELEPVEIDYHSSETVH